MDGQVTIVVVPLAAQGHLAPLLHFSRGLVAASGLSVHFVSSDTHIRQAKDRAQSATNTITFHSFPLPPFHNPPPNPDSPDKFPVHCFSPLKALASLREPVYALMRELSMHSRRLILVFDSMMAHVVQDVAALPNAEAYCFPSSNAFSTYSLLCQLAGKTDVDVPEAIKSVPPPCFPPEFSEILEVLHATPEFHSGYIYNTSRVIDGAYLDLIVEGKMSGTNKKHWAVGPFHLLFPIQKTVSNRCIEWLNNQNPNSVIYVSFGTTISLSDVQIAELAVGLEKSGQKFLWVLRDADRGNIFDGEIRQVPLPERFEERVEGRGIVIRDWAPQLEILGHNSIGGFMTPCGINSFNESLSMGVPMAAWPMHSDQPINTVLITKVLKAGLQVMEWEQRLEVVSSGRIEEVVRRLMASAEGDELRQRAADLGYAIQQSVADNGISRLEMDLFLRHITRRS